MLKRQGLMFGDETNLLAKNRVDTGLRAFILELRPTNADGTSHRSSSNQDRKTPPLILVCLGISYCLS